jgi:lipoprotein-anchoring transpeptidase ErfK/SrfK
MRVVERLGRSAGCLAIAAGLGLGGLGPTSVPAFAATAPVVAPTVPPTLVAPALPVAATPGISTQTVVAAAKNRLTPIYATPDAATPKMSLDNRKNFSGRHVFVVVSQQGAWYQVKVASRPNGLVGWVKASDVTLYQHDYAITVQLSTHTLIAYKSGKEFLRTTVAVGQSKYPTPTGSYFIRELARPSNPGGAYGPYAFGLSAYSNVLTKFGRGDGQIGIHGTNRPKELGTNASHGCVRVPNAVITKLAQTLPQGVPVEIIA